MAEKKQSIWLLETSLEFAKQSSFGTLVWWIVIIILVLQMSGLSIGTITDKWFGLEEKKMDQSYELQLKTFDFLQVDVMERLDDIYSRLNSVEDDVSDLKKRVLQIEIDHNK